MKIFVGSQNRAKVLAVKETIKQYPALKGALVFGKAVESGVSDQPKSFRETVRGAKNRARGVYKKGELAIGLESGLIRVPGSRNGFMDICVAVIYNGKKFAIGLSSGFECPPKMNQLIMKEGMDMTQAANKIGLTQNPKLGSAEGLIGILTKGRVDRQEYTKQALIMALIQLENPKLYAEV